MESAMEKSKNALQISTKTTDKEDHKKGNQNFKPQHMLTFNEDPNDEEMEDEKVEPIGKANPNVLERMSKPNILISQADALRPFSPPFAQVLGIPKTKKVTLKEEDNKVEVMFDPLLKCYYDPKTNMYYQRSKN
jgi:hypothetical protein